MKKRLNVLCILMLALMLVQLVYGGYYAMQALSFFKSLKEYSVEDGINGEMIFITVFSLIGISVLLYFLLRGFTSLCRFILNVNFDKVFVKENIQLLRWTGWGFLVYNLAVFFSKLMVFYVNNGYMLPIQFNITYKQHETGFIFCVFCLIMAEVFAIGLKLKEEQELTI